MLVFLDESGDTGRKIQSGSSPYFLVSAVIFSDNDEAFACDQRIDLLRRELAKPVNYEFHFAHNSKRVRQQFLEVVTPYNFTYCTVAINKDPQKLIGESFNHKSSFYKYACDMVITNASPYLDDAILVVDKSGGSTFQGELKRYLRGKPEDSQLRIRKIKQQESHKNNLLQLADYCVGICGRKVQNMGDWQDYYKFIAAKELSLQIWPKYG